MPKLSKAAQAEIREAIRIVREDKTQSGPRPPKDGDPPPAKPADPAEPPKNVRPGFWWGTRLHDTGE